MKAEPKHFTTEKTCDNSYGWTWAQVVNEYLRSGYMEDGGSPDIVVCGVTYKTLKRDEVTVFYDAAGNTIFDVENKRLEEEYRWLMDNGTGGEADQEDGECGEAAEEDAAADEAAEDTESDDVSEDVPTDDEEQGGEGPVTPMGKVISGIEKEAFEAAVADNAESPADSGSAKQGAKKKLEKELKDAKDSTFADPVIGYLLKRCEEDEGLAQDVLQEHKTWKKCFDYIYAQARKQSKGNCAAVRDDVVYEWAEDYYHKDDKAEEEKKAKKEAEDKAKREKAAAERKAAAKEKPEKAAVPAPVPERKAEEPKDQGKPKKNAKGMEGQMDMFSLMGM